MQYCISSIMIKWQFFAKLRGQKHCYLTAHTQIILLTKAYLSENHKVILNLLLSQMVLNKYPNYKNKSREFQP